MAYTKAQMNLYMRDRRKAKKEGLTVKQWRKLQPQQETAASLCGDAASASEEVLATPASTEAGSSILESHSEGAWMVTRSSAVLQGQRNQCPSCGLLFTRNSVFDKHRTGRFGKDRRCMTPEEMEAIGCLSGTINSGGASE